MLRQWARNRGPYFQKVFLSYCLVVALPMLMLCVLNYQSGIRNVRREIISGQASLCAQIGGSVQERLEDAAFLTEAISRDETLANPDASHAEQTVSRLRDYWRFNRLFSDILIYDLDQTYYSAKDGVLTAFPGYALFGSREQAYFNSYITDRKSHLAYFAQGSLMAWIVPIKEKGLTVIGVIDRQLLYDLCDISGSDALSYGSLILFDSQGQAALYIDRGGVLEYRDGKARMNTAENDVVFTHSMPDVGWSLVTVLPGAYLHARTQTAHLLLWMVGTVLVAALLVLLASHWYYRPIHALSALAGLEEDEKEDFASNELVSIGTALAAGQQWSDRALYQKGVLRESLVLRLISGGVTAEEDLPRTLQNLDMLMRAEEYQVLVIHRPSEPGKSVSHAALINYIDVRYSRQDLAYAVETETNNMRLVVMLLKISFGASSPADRMIRDLRLFIRHRMKTEFYFGVGLPHALGQVSVSYIEAVTALYQCPGVDGTALVLHYRDLADSRVLESRYNPEFQKKLQLYHSSLRAVNDTAAWQMLRDMEQECMDTATWRYSAARMTDTVLQIVMARESEQLRRDPDFPELSRQLNLALSANTAEEHHKLMQDITRLVLKIMHSQAEQQENEARTRLLEWMNAHICDPNLSLEMLTAAFGFSPSYWSRLFTEQIGVSFSDWVWQSRLVIVKDRLLHSGATVRQIIQDVGYADVSSFSRRFKVEEGMPPGQYRAAGLQRP